MGTCVLKWLVVWGALAAGFNHGRCVQAQSGV